MKKRIISLLLILVFITAVIFGGGGCKKIDEETTQEKSTQEASSDQTAKDEPAGPKYSFPWKGDPVTLSFMWVDFSYGGRTYDQYMDEVFKEKILGNVTVKENNLGWGDIGPKYDVLLAAGELPDIAIIGDATNVAIKYASSGTLLDFSKYLDLMPNYSALAAKYPKTWLGKTEEGNIYAITQPLEFNDVGMGWNLNSYYTAKGLKAPDTMDEMYQYLKQVKQMTPESTPLIGHHDHGAYTTLFFNSFNTKDDIFFNYDTNKWEYGPYNRGFKDYAMYMNKLYREKLINQEYITQTIESRTQILGTADLWAINPGYLGYPDAVIEEIKKEQSADYDITYLLPPKSDGNSKRWVPLAYQEGTDHGNGVFSNAKTKDPEFLCAFLDFLLSPMVDEVVNWGVEGKTFKVVDGEKVFMEDLKIAANYPGGTVDPLKDLGLALHFMIKQMGMATRDNWAVMDLNYVTPKTLANKKIYKDFIEQNPSSMRGNEPVPTLSEADNDIIAKIMPPVKTFVEEQIVKFIFGDRSFDEWDSFIAEIEKMGDPQVVVDIYNSKPRVKLIN